MRSRGNNGSELHRLKTMQENYDQTNVSKVNIKYVSQLIRNLTKQN